MQHLQLSLLALVPSIVGLYIGRWIRLRIDEERFQQMFLLSVLLLGGYISYQAVVKM
jgi:uncharacterized membrane protein YfcA